MLRDLSKLVALSLALLQPACGGALSPPFTPPESGGPAWVKVSSKHVDLRSDLSESEAREACSQFEQIYQMFEDIAFPYAAKPNVRTVVVLLKSEAEYEVIGPRGSAGYFHRAAGVDDYFEPTAIFFGDLTARTRLVFQHELTHRFIDFYFPTRPVWFDEGMADYYSTMQVEGDKVVLGRDLPDRFFRGGLTWSYETTPMWSIAHVPVGSALTVRELLSIGRSDFYSAPSESATPSEKEQASKRQTANYASAWALINLLQNGPEPYPQLFQAFLEKLAANVDADAAFQGTFGGVASKLEGDYQAWLAPIDRIVRKAPYELPPAQELKGAIMSPADVHVLWASIWPTRSDAGRARVRSELDAAIRLDPKNASARVWLAQIAEDDGNLDEAEQGLRSALSAAPDDPGATYALFRLLVRRASRKGASEDLWRPADALLPKVLSIATSARIQNGAARYLGLRDRADEGIPLAVRAVKSDPSCWQCFDTLAQLLAQKGEFAKAQQAQLIAVSLLPERVDASGLEARLRQYAKSSSRADEGPPCGAGEGCAAQAPAPPTPTSSAPPASAADDFNRGAATSALRSATLEAKKCKQAGGPAGSAKVTVGFDQSGAVTSVKVSGAQFEGTPTGECVASAFRRVHVPPFSKDAPPVTVALSVTIP